MADPGDTFLVEKGKTMYEHLIEKRVEGQPGPVTPGIRTNFGLSVDWLTLVGSFFDYDKNLSKLSAHMDWMDTIPAAHPYRWKVRLASELHVQVAEPHSNVPNVRIDINPNKFNPEGTIWHDLVSKLKPRSRRLTRIDYAIDYQEDLSLWSYETDRARKSNAWYSQDRKLETLYLGANQSKDQYRIYDKAREQGQDVTWWRIEHQLRMDPDQHWRFLRPFQDLTIWQPSEYTGNYVDDLILNDLHRNHGNMFRLSKHNRQKYRNMMKDSTRVIHKPVHPRDQFQAEFPPVEKFISKLLGE